MQASSLISCGRQFQAFGADMRNHSGFYDKHNCPQRNLIPGPRALQSDMLPLDHTELENIAVELEVINSDVNRPGAYDVPVPISIY